jgi:hypothetical protein
VFYNYLPNSINGKITMRIKIAANIFFIFSLYSYSYGQCFNSNTTFQSGEKVTYNVFYNLGFIWFNAAEASFAVKTRVYNHKEVFHFDSYGRTLPNYDWIYKVRDHFQSYADSVSLAPYYFSRSTSEGSYKVNAKNIFNYKQQVIYSTIENSKTPKYNDTVPLQLCTFDVLTAIYACRNVDISKLAKNDTIPLKMLVDNKIYNLYLRYLGLENAQLNDGSMFRCKKFTILMIEGMIFSGGENISIWISDDKAKIPIRVEAQILVGSIVAELNEVSGNKWPINSKISDRTIKE